LITSSLASEETFLRAARIELITGSGGALVILKTASERFPHSIAIALAFCRVALEMGHLGMAAVAAERIFREQPTDLSVGLNYVRILTWNEHFVAALDVAQGMLNAGERASE